MDPESPVDRLHVIVDGVQAEAELGRYLLLGGGVEKKAEDPPLTGGQGEMFGGRSRGQKPRVPTPGFHVRISLVAVEALPGEDEVNRAEAQTLTGRDGRGEDRLFVDVRPVPAVKVAD